MPSGRDRERRVGSPQAAEPWTGRLCEDDLAWGVAIVLNCVAYQFRGKGAMRMAPLRLHGPAEEGEEDRRMFVKCGSGMMPWLTLKED